MATLCRMLLKCRQLGSCMFKHGATVVTTKQSKQLHRFCGCAAIDLKCSGGWAVALQSSGGGAAALSITWRRGCSTFNHLEVGLLCYVVLRPYSIMELDDRNIP